MSMAGSTRLVLDPYAVLGVEPTASDDELRAAWRDAVRALHPDTRDDDVPAAEADAALRLVNEAWAVVGDPQRRRAFDAGWSLEDGPDRADDQEWWTRPSHAHATRLARHPWWVVVLVVLLAIFVFTAYAGAPAGPVR
jgi:curved DNA-binding protein CbpA